MEKIKKRLFSILLFILTAGFLLLPLSASAEKMTHVVKQGDTLWDICEDYYGDSDLWPKLWEMNSFITNPNLLVPGDVITLFEKTPQEPPVEPEVIEPPVVEEEPPVMGIGLEGVINTDDTGFYSPKKIAPWGTLFATSKQQIILGKGDIVYIIFEEGKAVNAGDEFSIGKISRVTHPITNRKAGYVFHTSGKIVIVKKSGLASYRKELKDKEDVYEAKIIESYIPVEVGDIVLPLIKTSNCILPVSNSNDILTNIIVAKDNKILIGQYSIIYFDKGTNDGITTGNIFEIVMKNIVKDPKPEKKLTPFKQRVILPNRSLGKALVINAFADSSTAVVLTLIEPVEPGVYLKSMSWEETPDFLRSSMNCPVE